MWEDPIIDEIHKTRENILKDNNYDIKKLFKQIQKNEMDLKKKGWNFVTKEELKKKESHVM